MLRTPLFTVSVFAVLAAADAVACSGLAEPLHTFSFPGLPYETAPSIRVPAFHAVVALLAALFGAALLPHATKLTRLTLLVFFLVFTFALPVLGILIIAALTVILGRPATGGMRPEERFVFGNPEATAARRESRDPHPTLTPLAEGLRSMDEDTLCQAILGLKHLRPVRSLAPFLQRFQQDPRTSVQFTAQAVLSRATETLEEAIGTLRQRLAADPTDRENRLALADTLEQLAAWTPPGDATTTIRREEATTIAGEILTTNPDDARALRLLARLQAAAGAGTSAEETATRLALLDTAGDAGAHQILLESLFHQARWDDLAAAAQLAAPPPGEAENHAFWTAHSSRQSS